MSIGIFYASNKGYAAGVAKKVASKLNVSDVFDVKDTPVSKMSDYDKLILVVATHKVGEIQNDLAAQIDEFKAINWGSKTVGIVGLGDAVNHTDTFNNAMGKIYDIVKAGNVIGFVEDSGYKYVKTESVRDGKFVGLPIDEITQGELTDSRIESWVNAVKSDLN